MKLMFFDLISNFPKSYNSSKSKVVLILATTWNTIKAQANQSGAAAIDKPVADKRIDPTLGYIL